MSYGSVLSQKETAMVTTGHSAVSIITERAYVDPATLSIDEWVELIEIAVSTLTLEGMTSLTDLASILLRESRYEETRFMGFADNNDYLEAPQYSHMALLSMITLLPKSPEWPTSNGSYELAEESFLAIRRSRDRRPYFIECRVGWHLKVLPGTSGHERIELVAKTIELNKGSAVLGRVLRSVEPDQVGRIGLQILQRLFAIQAETASALRGKAEHARRAKGKLERFLKRLS